MDLELRIRAVLGPVGTLRSSTGHMSVFRIEELGWCRWEGPHLRWICSQTNAIWNPYAEGEDGLGGEIQPGGAEIHAFQVASRIPTPATVLFRRQRALLELPGAGVSMGRDMGINVVP